MADNVVVTNQRTTFEADTNTDIPARTTEKSGHQVQHVIIDYGGTGAESTTTPDFATQTTLSAINTKLNASVAITASSLPLPTGAATETTLQAVLDGLTPQVYSLRYDEGATYTYIGEATAGTATSAASWRIKRLTNADNTIIWADGNTNFDNIYDNRASLSYS